MDASTGVSLTEDDRKRIVIGVLLAMALAALDQAIVAPAVPAMRAALNDDVYFPWIVSAYFLTATASTPLYGKFADIHGRRPVLFAAIAIFTIGSVACALSSNMLAMVLSRGLQGLGGGGLIALAQTIIADVVAPRERGKYVVYITTIWAASSLAGPILGGFLSQYLHWSLIFWINLPLAAAAFLMSRKTLLKLPQRQRDHRLDYPGAFFLVVSSVCLMLALTWAGTRHPWASGPILGLLAAFAAFLLLFIWRLKTADEPLVPLAVLANPIVRAGTMAVFLIMGAYIGISVYVPLFFEVMYGFDAGAAGGALVVFLAATVLGSNTTGRYMGRVKHYKRMPLAGCAVAALATAAFACFAGSLSFAQAVAAMVVMGIGTGAVFPVVTVAVQNSADPRDLGITTATFAFFRSLGSTIGVAVLGAILSGHGVAEHHESAIGAANVAPAGAALGFSLAFGAAALAMAFGLVAIILMEERPLRGRDTPPVSPET